MKKSILFSWVTDLETVHKLGLLNGKYERKLYIDTAWGVKRLYSCNREYEVKYFNPELDIRRVSEWDLSLGLSHAGTSVYVGLDHMDEEEDYTYHLIFDNLQKEYLILEGEEDVDWEAYYETKLKINRNRWEYLYSFKNKDEARFRRLKNQNELNRKLKEQGVK